MFNLVDTIEFAVNKQNMYIKVDNMCWVALVEYNKYYNTITASEDIRCTAVGDAKPYSLQSYLDLVLGASTGIRVEDNSVQKRFIFDSDDCVKLAVKGVQELNTGDILAMDNLYLVLGKVLGGTLVCWDLNQRKVTQVYPKANDPCSLTAYRARTLWFPSKHLVTLEIGEIIKEENA